MYFTTNKQYHYSLIYDENPTLLDIDTNMYSYLYIENYFPYFVLYIIYHILYNKYLLHYIPY